MIITEKETVFRGVMLSWGIAMGPLFFFTQSDPFKSEERKITARQVKGECSRFLHALRRSRDDIERLKSELEKENIKEGAAILDAHLQMMQDPGLISSTEKKIKELNSAETAFHEVISDYLQKFENIEDPFFRERAKDVLDIGRRVLSYLREIIHHPWDAIAQPSIIIAEEMNATWVAEFNPDLILAIITEKGSSTSHAAIVARARGIPYICGISGENLAPFKGSELIVDAHEGKVIVNPSEKRRNDYAIKKAKEEKELQAIRESIHLKAETYDGYEVRLSANVDVDSELDLIHQFGGQGVGLFRSEYVFLAHGKFPSEEEQYEIYRSIVEKMQGLPIVIRAFDIGGDKGGFPLQSREDNPYLGCRAIRFLLKEKKIFKTQLRAILRAAAHGDVSIMFPMVSGLSELYEAKKMLKEAESELKKEKIPYKESIRIGSMIEVPSAAIIADLIAKECDFLSIGTNDLVQYSLAVDRGNQSMSCFYTPTHPGVIRLIKMIVTEANRQGIPVTVCGEIAADPRFTPLLLGLGVHELSLAARYIPRVKNQIRAMSIVRGAALAEEVLSMRTPQEIAEHLEAEFERNS